MSDVSLATQLQYVPYFKPWWWFGRPADFWAANHQLVAEAIRKYNPTRVKRGQRSDDPLPIDAPKVDDIDITIDPDQWGGMRCPHLHFGNDVYLLTDEQWQAFSRDVIKKFGDRLSRVKAVNFQQLMELSEGVGSLPVSVERMV